MRASVLRVAILIITAGALAGAPSTASGAPAPVDAKSSPTRFALGAFGIGTAVSGGTLPPESGKTAYRIIGCTNRAGVERENHEAEADVPGLGTVSGVTTRVWTTDKGGQTASRSIHEVASIVIGEGSGFGTVELKGITSSSVASHDASGFHAAYTTDLAKIVYRPIDGGPEVLVPPVQGQTLEVPNLARIKIGSHSRHADSGGARAYATALKIEVLPTDTVARVAHTSAKIGSGVKTALFRGNSNATRASALDDIVTSGPTPHLPMPCQGTGGDVKRNDLAGLDLAGQVALRGLTTAERADQSGRRAEGWQRAGVAAVEIGGRLEIRGVVGQVNVRREGGDVRSDTKGTTLGSITLDGEAQELPDPGQALVVPGLASIETRVVEQLKAGLAVTAVRVTLLDGTGLVLDLGQARLQVLRSGL